MPFPSIAVVDHQRSPRERPVLVAQQSTDMDDVIELKKRDGTILDLTDAGRVQLLVKDSLIATTPYIQRDVAIASATEGTVQVQIPASVLDVAGIFLVEFVVYEGTSSTAYYRVPAYMDVMQTLAVSSQVVGVHLEDVRYELYDRSAEDNFLLADVEFTDSQICWAVLKTVGTYNETQPVVGTTYSAVDFPYREQWISGTVAELLMMAAKGYARNDLSYQAGGTAINDKNKAQQYLQLGATMKKEFQAWAKEVKTAENMMENISSSAAWGFG